MHKVLYIVLCCCVGSFIVSAQSSQQVWVDSLYSNMTDDQRIGQLFMIRAYSKSDNKDVNKILSSIEKYHIGGLCFFQGDPTHQASLTNKYQQKSKTPLMIAIDGEWGLGMRFKNKAISFPRQLMLGAIQDNNIIYEMGKEIASHLKRIGVHVNFAPVVDVNNNPKNPVINDRSFGEDKFNVISKSYAYMKGMQDMGIMACMKHFPGHGDTDVDSHLDLPVINHSKGRLDSIELLPFKIMAKQGIASTMVAHLHIPAIDDAKNIPTTLSQKAITGILKDEIGFSGLIYTDAMDMKGVSKHFPDGKADLMAFEAGADIILLPNDLEKGVNAIKKALQSGDISRDRLAYSVKKILRAKYAVGLASPKQIKLDGISKYINSNKSLALKEKLIEQAITLVSNKDNIVPIADIANNKIATIAIGVDKPSAFQKTVKRYVNSESFQIDKNPNLSQLESLNQSLKNTDLVIVTFNDMSKYAQKNFGIDTTTLEFLDRLQASKKLVVVIHGSPYALKYFEKYRNVIVTYNDENLTQNIAAQSIFGSNPLKGRLPVGISPNMRNGTGIYKEGLGRLGFSIPERVGMNSHVLSGLDDLAYEMISEKAAPGGQVLVAKNGKVVYEKSYGYHTYEKETPTNNNHIYDVASITKVCASTLCLMKLYDEDKLDLNASLNRYLHSEVDTSNKKDINIRAMLAHHARLAGWIPFYANTISDSKTPTPLKEYYSDTKNSKYNIQVKENLYMRSDYRDSIWSRIYASELKEKKGYRYSDLSFYMFHKIIRRLTNYRIDDYSYNEFYKPLGLSKTGYLPLQRHNQSIIAPTEEDNYFRQGRIQGYVHDMGAAMFGGVAGHAGLFSNAYELGIIFQMLLNEGSYGGKEYLKPSTVKTFTKRYHESSRRGLGFDMKELDNAKTLNMSEMASASTFGHLGFTGISAFADPEYDLIFIFITNRTYPSMKNNKFGKGDYRPKAQTIVYKSMMENTNYLN